MDTSLYDMKNVGRRDLPEAANQYALATQDLAGMDTSGAFPDEAAQAFAGLTASVQTMLADVCDYLIKSGDAIVDCADAYAAQDNDAAADLDKCERDRTYHKGGPDDLLPPVRPGEASEYDNEPIFNENAYADEHNEPIAAA